ncbi:hypothetical protein [Natronobacterium gregoryi]|uniref:Uncharacterized protein n=2 Tax=Natronobacterium gregoryi TaxID=44930 RepID=L0AGC5_NATGS|nr:hypothetical protein [Natronobacterium gregoryi]AFZ72207.1 hypothetical protein Natgr_0976 [Natronobacterium gregoryi SP2]ELY62393.1 hypothetical protein C490_18588 [Natronobacterium gregoryi SP2]PLK20157.1 hypothetical protein CYV19_10710 [Natronobacterium gregoryi SP2]SFJ28076.1 hypothetical protein SAMN05443661_1205 [Natronobacterium gregoryi]
MNLAQVALGTGLLGVSTLAFVGPTMLESYVLYTLIGLGLVVGTVALLACRARETLTVDPQ